MYFDNFVKIFIENLLTDFDNFIDPDILQILFILTSRFPMQVNKRIVIFIRFIFVKILIINQFLGFFLIFIFKDFSVKLNSPINSTL